MTAPVDPNLATAAAAQNDLVRRKLEMDALRDRLRKQPEKEEKLREACQGFESIFVQKMWEQMRATLPKEGYLHSKEEAFWQSMFDQELAKKMTSAGGIGLADMIYEQLSQRLTDASRTTAPGSVREPVPLKPVSVMPRVVTPEAADGGASGMYAPASADAPVAQADGEGTPPAGHVAGPTAGPAAGNDLVQRHLADLERQLAAAPAQGATPVASASVAGPPMMPAPGTAASAVPGGASAPQNLTGAQAAQPGGAAQLAAPGAAAAAPAEDAARRDATRGLPAASVAGEHMRKVRSPMRDGRANAPLVQRAGTGRRVSSPGASRPFASPAPGMPVTPVTPDMSGAPAPGAAEGASPVQAQGMTPAAPTGGMTPAAPAGLPAASETGQAAGVAAPGGTGAERPARVSPTGGPAIATGTPGSMSWPHEGRIASGFGWRDDPLTGERAWHPGVDIAVREGDPVRAAWDGRVVIAGERADYGQLVVLEHPGGWRSFYGHNGSLGVREGDMVRAGTEIAKAGGTGRVAGPHLHFEVRQGELAVNPEYAARGMASGVAATARAKSGG